jgi:GcrA cell cycle regulator
MTTLPPAWTTDRVNALKKLWGQGKSASEIAEHLGGVTRNAVIGKAHRLGLSGRPSPIKKPVTRTAAIAKTPAKPAPKSTAKAAAPKVTPKIATTAARPTVAAVRAAAPAKANAAKAVATKIVPLKLEAAKPSPKPVVTAEERSKNPLAGQLAPPTPINPAANRPLTDAPLISILELTERVCRWPVGDPRDPGFGFCGAPIQPGLPYCGGHAVLAFQAPARRDNRKLINVAPGVTVAPNDDEDLDDEDLVIGDDTDTDDTPLSDDELDDEAAGVGL